MINLSRDSIFTMTSKKLEIINLKFNTDANKNLTINYAKTVKNKNSLVSIVKAVNNHISSIKTSELATSYVDVLKYNLTNLKKKIDSENNNIFNKVFRFFSKSAPIDSTEIDKKIIEIKDSENIQKSILIIKEMNGREFTKDTGGTFRTSSNKITLGLQLNFDLDKIKKLDTIELGSLLKIIISDLSDEKITKLFNYLKDNEKNPLKNKDNDFIKNYLTLLNKVYNKEFISREKVSSKDKADSENEETALTALVTLEKLVIGEANIILKELLKKAGNDPRKQQEAQKEYRKILTENQNVLKRYITVDNEAAAQ